MKLRVVIAGASIAAMPFVSIPAARADDCQCVKKWCPYDGWVDCSHEDPRVSGWRLKCEAGTPQGATTGTAGAEAPQVARTPSPVERRRVIDEEIRRRERLQTIDDENGDARKTGNETRARTEAEARTRQDSTALGHTFRSDGTALGQARTAKSLNEGAAAARGDVAAPRAPYDDHGKRISGAAAALPIPGGDGSVYAGNGQNAGGADTAAVDAKIAEATRRMSAEKDPGKKAAIAQEVSNLEGERGMIISRRPTPTPTPLPVPTTPAGGVK